MSFQSRVTDLAVRIAQEFNLIRQRVFVLSTKQLGTTPIINQTTTPNTVLTVTTPSLTADDIANKVFKIEFNGTLSLNDGAQDYIVEIQQVAPTTTANIILQGREEPKDVAGTGVTGDVVGGGTINSGTNQRHLRGGCVYLDNITTPGVYTYNLRVYCSASNDRATFYAGWLAFSEEKFA